MNEWYCPECDAKNSGSVKTCTSCGCPKPADAVAATSISSGSTPKKWTCNICNYENPAKANKCLECGAVRGSQKEKKKINPMLIVIPAAILCFFVIPMVKGIYGRPAPAETAPVTTTKREPDPDMPSAAVSAGVTYLYKGKLLEFNEYDGGVVIKTKITSSFNNQATVNLNYRNVEDLIVNQGCSRYDEIQYWAVADLSDGTEGKVVSFTVPKSTITKIKNGDIVVTQMGDYVDDLYILPSLRD